MAELQQDGRATQPVAPKPEPPPTTATPTSSTPPASGGRLTPEQIAQAAYDAGFRGDALATAVAIALAESSGNAGALNPNGEHSVGLWQINMDAHGQRFGSEQELYDPLANAKAAFALSQGGKRWTPWTTFTGATTSGANNPHTRHMDAARRAAAAVEGGEVFDYTVASGGGRVQAASEGGVGAVSAGGFDVPTIDGATQMSDDQLRSVMRRDFGYLAWALDIPEVGDVLLKMARGEVAGDRAFAAIQATNWWRTTEAATREWDALENHDPAEAQDQVNQQALNLRLTASRLGFDIAPDRLAAIARDSLRFGWSPAEVRAALSSEVEWGGGTSGETGASVTDLKGIAEREYMVPMTRAQAAEWQRRIFLGEASEDGFRESMRRLAARRFPGFEDDIASGVTPAMLFDTYKAHAAEVLEMDADQIDLLNDPKFSRALQVRDEKGQLRPMTLSEWQTHVRGLPEWRKTRNAQQSAAGVVSALGRVFGKV